MTVASNREWNGSTSVALFWTTGGLALLGPVVEAADALSRSRARHVVACVPWLSIGFGAKTKTDILVKHAPISGLDILVPWRPGGREAFPRQR